MTKQELLSQVRELFIRRSDALESKNYDLANELNTKARKLLRENDLGINDYIAWNKDNPKGNPLRTTAKNAADDAIKALKAQQEKRNGQATKG